MHATGHGTRSHFLSCWGPSPRTSRLIPWAFKVLPREGRVVCCASPPFVNVPVLLSSAHNSSGRVPSVTIRHCHKTAEIKHCRVQILAKTTCGQAIFVNSKHCHRQTTRMAGLSRHSKVQQLP
eukprot:1157293-Pelagomonas_calceolata.AAC.2